MNRYKLLAIQPLFDYANCTHAVAADLNAAYKFYLIREKVTNFGGTFFEMISKIQKEAFPKGGQPLINLMNLDSKAEEHLKRNPGDKAVYVAYMKYMLEAFEYSVPDPKAFLEEVFALHW